MLFELEEVLPNLWQAWLAITGCESAEESPVTLEEDYDWESYDAQLRSLTPEKIALPESSAQLDGVTAMGSLDVVQEQAEKLPGRRMSLPALRSGHIFEDSRTLPSDAAQHFRISTPRERAKSTGHIEEEHETLKAKARLRLLNDDMVDRRAQKVARGVAGSDGTLHWQKKIATNNTGDRQAQELAQPEAEDLWPRDAEEKRLAEARDLEILKIWEVAASMERELHIDVGGIDGGGIKGGGSSGGINEVGIDIIGDVASKASAMVAFIIGLDSGSISGGGINGSEKLHFNHLEWLSYQLMLDRELAQVHRTEKCGGALIEGETGKATAMVLTFSAVLPSHRQLRGAWDARNRTCAAFLSNQARWRSLGVDTQLSMLQTRPLYDGSTFMSPRHFTPRTGCSQIGLMVTPHKSTRSGCSENTASTQCPSSASSSDQEELVARRLAASPGVDASMNQKQRNNRMIDILPIPLKVKDVPPIRGFHEVNPFTFSPNTTSTQCPSSASSSDQGD